ncbi:MAG: hypothetical protein ACRD1K_04330 [Acidimicrobiales bacterium]
MFATWLGVHLDTAGVSAVDWNEIANIIEDAFRVVAPTRLVAQLNRR